MDVFDQLAAWIQTHPMLFAAIAGSVLSTGHLLLMLATRLGQVKPGFQSLILSGVIHAVLGTFWYTLAVTDDNPPRRPVARVPSQPPIIIDEYTVIEESDFGNDVPLELSSSGPQDKFARAEPKSYEVEPLATVDRTRETVEPVKGSLPDLPQPEEMEGVAPQPLAAAEPVRRDAVEESVDIGEETADSRPDVVVSTAPVRGMSERAAAPDEEVQREPLQGSNPRANVAVQVSPPPGSGKIVLDRVSTERTQTESKLTRPQAGLATAAAAQNVEVDDAGIPDGAATGNLASGAQNESKFVRAGRPLPRNDVAGTVERSRPVERPAGTNPRAPMIASLSPGRVGSPPPLSDRPGISTPNFNAIPSRESAKLPDTYRLRSLPQRKKMAVNLGATQDSERAVEVSLRWLALHQHPEGYWDADGFDANCPAGDRCWGRGGQGNPSETEKINNPVNRLALESAGQHADAGLTALVMLTFLGAGYTQEEGQYADQVDRAVRWLIRNQQSNGFLGGEASHYERMYCHGMATYALGEACGMLDDPDSDPQLKQALAKAVRYIIAMQNPNDGGWRYLNGKLAKQEGDMSMFGWQLMALKSSQIAGIDIPEETQVGMVKFLKRISLGERRGLASYRFGEAPKASMTAEALFSRQMLGMKRDNPSSIEAVEYLMKHPPHQTEQDLYYWYYGTLAMYQYGGEPWRRWNDQLRDTLVATQRKTGHAAGSWDPRDNWSLHGGRLYSTALSTLCLEVYYRFLPLYQLNGPGADVMDE